MKVAIDCRALRKSPSGIPNFVVAAINGFILYNPNWKLYLLSNESFNEDLDKRLLKTENVEIIITPLPIFKSISFLWLLFKAKGTIERIQPDLYWAPAFLLPPIPFKKVKTLVTIHDLVFKEHKETMSFLNRFFFYLLHDWSIKRADLIWSNSAYTKTGIDRYFPSRKCQEIFVGFFINNHVFRRLEISPDEARYILGKHKLNDKFLLFVGTLEPRKNLSFLLSLMPALAQLGYSLLVVGAKGWGKSEINDIISQENFPSDKVSFAGFVSTDELVKVFNLASVYVSTSLNEGFGMPQLEAMACGCPVVSSHNSAMIEVVEGAGETVKGWDAQEWVNTIEKVGRHREEYKILGYKRIQDFEVEKVINKLTDYISC